jgi:murein DD-endopeptidase MepM/ murein hydrolase activator NlpD
MWQRPAKAQVPDFKQLLTLFRQNIRDMLDGISASEASTRLALARARVNGGPAADAPEPFSLVVDLASEPVGKRWLRGAATLAGLCAAALTFTPGIDPFSPAIARTVVPQRTFQLNPMLGASEAAAAAPKPQVPLDPEQAAKPVIASDGNDVRVQGAVTDGLYWSLRGAGVSPQITADYLHALSTRIDVGDVAPWDRFDLVVSKSPGQPLLYAALHRVDGPDVELMKWNANGKVDWFDTDASGADRSDALMSPVAGRITSGFGMRFHPILHYARMHTGLDFGAAWGSPIVAAADGQVVVAGGIGGYGRAVEVAHGGGIMTLYGHMSAVAATPGQMVRQGQVIGYVGSSGLSTGPHLHFEVRINGRPVDPMTARLQSRNVISGPAKVAFNARLKQLMAIGAGV